MDGGKPAGRNSVVSINGPPTSRLSSTMTAFIWSNSNSEGTPRSTGTPTRGPHRHHDRRPLVVPSPHQPRVAQNHDQHFPLAPPCAELPEVHLPLGACAPENSARSNPQHVGGWLYNCYRIWYQDRRKPGQNRSAAQAPSAGKRRGVAVRGSRFLPG